MEQRVARLTNELEWLSLLTSGASTLELMCECGRADCMSRLTVSRQVYRRIRAHATCFIVVPGHEQPTDRIEYRDDTLVIAEVG